MKAYYFQIKINNKLRTAEFLELKGEYKKKNDVHIIIDDRIGPQQINGECFKEENAYSQFLDDYIYLSNEKCVIGSHEDEYDIYSIGFTYKDDVVDLREVDRDIVKEKIKKDLKEFVKSIIKSEIDELTALMYKVDENI